MWEKGMLKGYGKRRYYISYSEGKVHYKYRLLEYEGLFDRSNFITKKENMDRY